MQNFPKQRKGPASNLASAFCSAAEFLSEVKIGGIRTGILLLFVALIAAMTAYNYLDTFLFAFPLIIGIIAGQVAHILICKRKGLSDYLIERGIRLASLGAGWRISYAFLDFDSFLGVVPIMVAPFVGDGVHALFRKSYRKA